MTDSKDTGRTDRGANSGDTRRAARVADSVDAGRADRAFILATGFGTSVAMWTIGYVCRIPPAVVPSWLLLLFLLATLLTGGWVAGRMSGQGLRAGLYTGLLASILNLLILGSLVTGQEPNRIVPTALLWVPGSILVGLGLGALGGAVGGRRPIATRTDWTAAFALVAAAATYLLLVVGGIVTSQKAGLAVVDWPNSFGYSMFLYPLSRMSGGIYYEHAHRLFGSLVGLTTLVLAIHVQRGDQRIWLRRFAILAVVAVVIQGLLGGLRVTGRFTMSQSAAETAPNIALAIVHGVFAQIFFGMMVAIAVFTTPTWKNTRMPTRMPSPLRPIAPSRPFSSGSSSCSLSSARYRGMWPAGCTFTSRWR